MKIEKIIIMRQGKIPQRRQDSQSGTRLCNQLRNAITSWISTFHHFLTADDVSLHFKAAL